MKGYIVEIDPEIETYLSKVMPGVKWTNWKPIFLPETDSLMEKLQDEVEKFLVTLTLDKIGSKRFKALMGKGVVAPRTWAKVIQRISAQCTAPKKEHMGEGTVGWRLIGQSLVRQTAESFGFVNEPAA